MTFYNKIFKQILFLYQLKAGSKSPLLIQTQNDHTVPSRSPAERRRRLGYSKQNFYQGTSINLRYTFLISGVLSTILFNGCVSNKSLPSAVYANNYSALTSDELKEISLQNKSLSKREAVNIALSNNPGYKISQNNAEAAKVNYYKSLGGLSPTLSAATIVGNGGSATGVSANARVFDGGAAVMNILGAKAIADQSEWDVKNHRRVLVQNVTTQDNQLNRISKEMDILEADQKFQTEMYEETLIRYKAGKATKSDVLNFQINALKAKNAIVLANSNYKTNSYKLAATMGMMTAELPGSVENSNNFTIIDNTAIVSGINYYLDLAIANRPDLKAQRDALRGAAYSMYAAYGSLLPSLDIGLGSGFYSVLKWNLWTGSSPLFAIRSREISYDVQQEKLLGKWITVVQEVRTEHDKLISSINRLKIMKTTEKEAIQRRNLVVKKYNIGKADIATLNQVQNDLVQTQESYKKAEFDVLNAKAGLNAACGIQKY